ncbi:succinyl-diaminopimelate desuccinylase [Actinoplanes campanulatus]|uniref:Succinyl-diaminopimelate desuccinylase n=1 Tax=Actinoplanes campanulatus TaxID=113559 RepID=A0A7W5AQM7_9ACTN|nr:succinyl-diaminopimelate desuccinylase [Actinoplanes campanulatus]MBB3100545.1 succinyl-diaminopimelate desuccinylase [Actinoplanes campanulatus]GGN45226.1 succinyl-diaminopimelate desuccinylase [Actinoplanes campanulatus]GID41024.1 succinyl-diaminopimelate desuccinylase [Actinoplanes campanulatus]
MTSLDLTGDVVDLTRTICDIPSVSGDEKALADAVEAALRAYPHLEVLRDGDAVVARTSLGRPARVVIAGHLDTVPIADNLPCVMDGDILRGRGTVDMKAGVAVMLRLAAGLTAPRHDLTFVFYDHEEVAAKLNGLGRLVRNHPEWLAGDFAILGEPSDGTVEGGCQGTIRIKITVPGVAAHAARSWKGSNAIHSAGAVLDVLRAYVPRQPVVDGLRYHEGLNAVKIEGGIAGNVIPDLCTVYVNHRFAPDRDVAGAEAHLREVFAGFEVEVVDAAPGARPGLDQPVAKEFVELVGLPPAPKLGWTDVSRFAALGIPAINFGPGDPLLAHTDGEHVPVPEIRRTLEVLTTWLS